MHNTLAKVHSRGMRRVELKYRTWEFPDVQFSRWYTRVHFARAAVRDMGRSLIAAAIITHDGR